MHLMSSTSPDRRSLRAYMTSRPLVVTLRRLWQWLILVHSDDPVRAVLNRGFAGLSTALMLPLVIMIVAFVISGETPGLLVTLITAPCLVFVWWLNRRGSAYGAAIFVLWTVVALVLGTPPSSYVTTLSTPIPLLPILPILIAALFVGPKWSVGTLVLLMTVIGAQLASSDVQRDYAVRFMLVATPSLTAVTLILITGIGIFTKALRTSVTANETMQQVNAELEQRVTERKQAEEALRRSEEGLRQVFDAVFEAVVIHDSGLILEVNRAFSQLSGYQRSEVIGKSASVLLPPEAYELIRAKIAVEDTDPYETLGLRKDGTTFPIEIVGKPVIYLGRAVRIWAIHDISARKLAETQRLELALARQKAELLNELLNTVSHDLKTPLSVINTSLYLLQRVEDP